VVVKINNIFLFQPVILKKPLDLLISGKFVEMVKFTAGIIALLFFFLSCNRAIKPEDLFGKWKYIKVEHPRASPPDSLTSADIKASAPYIQFTQNKQLVIVWDGRVLSHGKFVIDDHNLVYTETMTDGKTRTFPFWVSKLTDKDLIFETRGEDGSRVTAVKYGH